MLSLIFKFLMGVSLIGGPVISGTVYLWKAFWAMEYFVGIGWALIWTFPMPLGIGTFPFWAKQMYGYSDPSIWFWYIGTFVGLGLGFVFSALSVFSDR